MAEQRRMVTHKIATVVEFNQKKGEEQQEEKGKMRGRQELQRSDTVRLKDR